MTDILILAVVVGAVGGAMRYIIKAKKNGAKCIGCPSGSSCGGSCSCHADSSE